VYLHITPEELISVMKKVREDCRQMELDAILHPMYDPLIDGMPTVAYSG